MRRQRLPILAPIATILVVTGIFSPAMADGNIVVAARETSVEVAPRAPGLELKLPIIEFALRAAIQCTGDPVTVTFSVADAFTTIGRDALRDQRAAKAAVKVPAGQLAPAATEAFCISEDTETSDVLFLPGFTTVHASLRCTDDDVESLHFASAPLQLRLSCSREPAENQESSDDPDR
jgi:hypothetical protein